MDAGANVNARDQYNFTPLHYVRSGEQAQCLIDAGADVNASGHGGQTPLHFASSADVTQVLVNSGADVNLKSKNGETPFVQALFYGSPEQAKILIRKGADHVLQKDNTFPMQNGCFKGAVKVETWSPEMSKILSKCCRDLIIENKLKPMSLKEFSALTVPDKFKLIFGVPRKERAEAFQKLDDYRAHLVSNAGRKMIQGGAHYLSLFFSVLYFTFLSKTN